MKGPLMQCLVISICFVVVAPAQVVDGSGATNYIPLWTSGSTIGTAKFFQTAGKIGLGTTTPSAAFDILGANGGGFNVPAMTGLNVKGGTGGPLASGGG